MRGSTIYAFSNVGLPSLVLWQSAILKLDLLAPVQMLAVGQTCEARIGERVARFACAEVEPETLIGLSDTQALPAWSRAFGFGDFGERIEATAAAIACVSYALATGGSLNLIDPRTLVDLDEPRHELDALLACALKREHAYIERYPDERPSASGGSMELSIVLQGDDRRE